MNIAYTHRSRAALQAAQALAQDAGHPELTPAHLALALLAEPEGVMSALLQRLEAEPQALAGELTAALTSLP
ncbi:MAG: Clp protease N-terminal domain-containing protein, partial [Planctomycetota bacterium]